MSYLEAHGKAVATLDTAPTRTGALSATIISAICPTADAPIRYQAGAMALPVKWISQVATSWVVPPKVAMATE